MKKGDSVLVKSVSGNWVNATFNHEYGGKFYVRLSCDNCLFEFDECKPSKQTVEEFTRVWAEKNLRLIYISHCGFISSIDEEMLCKYYNDREEWRIREIWYK